MKPINNHTALTSAPVMDLREITYDMLAGGQMVIRPIRGHFPLSSQQLNDMFDEMKADLQSIITTTVDMGQFQTATAPGVTALQKHIAHRCLSTTQINPVVAEPDHTTDWRIL